MNYDTFRACVDEAEQLDRLANRYAEQMLRLVTGRLRQVDNSHLLRRLKTELRDFDMRTGEWRR